MADPVPRPLPLRHTPRQNAFSELAYLLAADEAHAAARRPDRVRRKQIHELVDQLGALRPLNGRDDRSNRLEFGGSGVRFSHGPRLSVEPHLKSTANTRRRSLLAANTLIAMPRSMIIGRSSGLWKTAARRCLSPSCARVI